MNRIDEVRSRGKRGGDKRVRGKIRLMRGKKGRYKRDEGLRAKVTKATKAK